VAQRLLRVHCRNVTLYLVYDAALGLLLLGAGTVGVRFDRDAGGVLDSEGSGDVLLRTHLLLAGEVDVGGRGNSLPDGLYDRGFVAFLELATRRAEIGPIVVDTHRRGLLFVLLLPFSNESLQVLGDGFHYSLLGVHEVGCFHRLFGGLVDRGVHIFPRTEGLQELDIAEVLIAVEVVDVYLHALDEAIQILTLFIVSAGILTIDFPEPALKALFLLADDLPHFLEEIGHNLSGIAIAVFEIFLVSLVLLQHFFESFCVLADSVHLGFPLGPDAVEGLRETGGTLRMLSISWFLWPSWRMHSMQMRRFSLWQKAAWGEEYLHTSCGACCKVGRKSGGR
jgi:hypothetical protein